jgi:hypothetical protein
LPKARTVIKKDEDYKLVFSEDTGLDVYLFCARTMKLVDEVLRSDLANIRAIETDIRRNFRFHVCTAAVARKIGSADYDLKGVRGIAADEFTQAQIAAAAEKVKVIYAEYFSKNPRAVDQIAKSGDFVTFMLGKL